MASATRPPSGAVEDDSYGFASWSDLANVTADDTGYASCALTSSSQTDSSVRLVVGGVISGDDKADGSGAGGIDPDAPVTYGGESDTWGLSLTPAAVNAEDFGVVFAVEDSALDGTYYLKATGFGFEVPDGATIDGVVFDIIWGQSSSTVLVDYLTLTVHYTEAGGATAAAMLTLGVG